MTECGFHPNVSITYLDRANRYVVYPQVEGAAAFEIEAGVVPMTGQDSVLEAAAFNRGAVARRSNVGRQRCVLQQSTRQNNRAGGAALYSGDLRRARIRIGRRPNELRHQFYRCLSPSRYVRRADPKGREAGRSAGHTTHQIRVRDQPQNRFWPKWTSVSAPQIGGKADMRWCSANVRF
jgi:hypothetical protein